MELAIQPSPEQLARSWEAHLLRTRDRITQFQRKLEGGVTGEGERVMIEEEITKLEGQLVRSDGMPSTEAAPSGVSQLQAEVRTLRALVEELLGRSSAMDTPSVV